MGVATCRSNFGTKPGSWRTRNRAFICLTSDELGPLIMEIPHRRPTATRSLSGKSGSFEQARRNFFPAGGCLSLVALRATGRAAERATEALHRRGHRLQSAETSMLTDMGIVTMHAWRWCHPARCDRGGRQTGPREPGYCWISTALQKPL